MANSWAAAEANEVETGPAATAERDWDQVSRALKGIRFGEVRVIIQDGRIVQIERLEKIRLR